MLIARHRQFKSRTPFAHAALELISEVDEISAQLTRRTTDGIGSGRQVLLDSTPLFHMLAPHHSECTYQGLLGLGLTTSALVLVVVIVVSFISAPSTQ